MYNIIMRLIRVSMYIKYRIFLLNDNRRNNVIKKSTAVSGLNEIMLFIRSPLYSKVRTAVNATEMAMMTTRIFLNFCSSFIRKTATATPITMPFKVIGM